MENHTSTSSGTTSHLWSIIALGMKRNSSFGKVHGDHHLDWYTFGYLQGVLHYTPVITLDYQIATFGLQWDKNLIDMEGGGPYAPR